MTNYLLIRWLSSAPPTLKLQIKFAGIFVRQGGENAPNEHR